MSFGDRCQMCLKPLGDLPGPELMDGQGRVYHLSCWCRAVDIRVQEPRERIAERNGQIAATKKTLANRLEPAEPSDLRHAPPQSPNVRRSLFCESSSFSLTGTVATWDPVGRWLAVGGWTFWIVPGASDMALAPCMQVTVHGHQEDADARWIVTALTVD